MITIFSIPKPFNNPHTSLIQHNAIRSWLALGNGCEIILFGDEEGIEETAKKYGIQNVRMVAKNEYGTPLLSSAFEIVQEIAKNTTIVYTNADIIISSILFECEQFVKHNKYLICGRRYDITCNEDIDLRKNEDNTRFYQKITKNANLHSHSGIDYFVFPKGQIHMPPFAVGRPSWDNWLIWKMRKEKTPVIDATGLIDVYHQDHNYSHSKFAQRKLVGGPELRLNMQIAGGMKCTATIRDADYILTKTGILKKYFPNNIVPKLTLFPPWAYLLGIKRHIQMIKYF